MRWSVAGVACLALMLAYWSGALSSGPIEPSVDREDAPAEGEVIGPSRDAAPAARDAHLSGRVLVDGEAPSGPIRLSITIESTPGAMAELQIETDAGGYFAADSLPRGTARIRPVGRYEWEQPSSTQGEVRIPSENVELRLASLSLFGSVQVRSARSLRFRTTDVDGNPVAGAVAYATDRMHAGSAPTDANGWSALPPTDRKRSQLFVKAEGFWSTQVDLDARAQPLQLTLVRANQVRWSISPASALLKRSALTIHLACRGLHVVRSSDGRWIRPSMSAWMHEDVPRALEGTGGLSSAGKTCAFEWEFAGRTLTLEGLPPGVALAWELRVGHVSQPITGRLEPLGESEQRQIEAQLDYDLRTLRARVVDPSGKPIAARVQLDQGRTSIRTDESGAFELQTTDAAVALSVLADGFETFYSDAYAISDSTEVREIVLQPDRPLQLRIVDEFGTPSAGVLLSIRQPSGSSRYSAQKLAPGHYEVLGAHRGPAFVSFAFEGMFVIDRPIEIDSSIVEVRLPPHCRIRFDWTLATHVEHRRARIVLEPMDDGGTPFVLSIDARDASSGSADGRAVGGRYRLHFVTSTGGADRELAPSRVVEIPTSGNLTLRVGS